MLNDNSITHLPNLYANKPLMLKRGPSFSKIYNNPGTK